MNPIPHTDDRLDAVLADYFQRLDRGDAVSPVTLIESHPDLEPQLREFFDAATFVERLAGPTQAEQTQMQSVHDTARNSLVGETIVSSLHSRDQWSRPAGSARPMVAAMQHFGRYEIVRLLGQGAMGAVYLAYDPSLQRQIALKIPKFADESNPDMSERFLREARSAAQLRHAHICPVYDVGRIDGVHYITMAYIEGRTLADELRAGRTFQPREIATIVRKLALALGKAHGAGVVHRDLKPGNIMLDPDGEPILMDFGLAYREETDELRLTKSGMIVGSPAYMSPEQIEGDPAKIGPASDIYSLGVVLYEMITGKLPFQGTMMSVIGQIASKEPTPVGHWRKDLADSPLERLCKKMLAKQPQQRPASMQDVAGALDYVLSGLKQEGERGREGEGETVQSRIAGSSPPLPISPSPTLFTPPAPAVKFPETVLAQERRDRAKMFLATTLILAALIGLFGVLAGVIYVATDQGTLEITSHVDNVKIEVASKDGSVKVFDLASGTEVQRLRSGDYAVRVVGDQIDVRLDKTGFKITRGGKVVVTAVHVARMAGPAVPTTTVPSTSETPAVARPEPKLPGPPPVARMIDHASSVRAVAFAPDGEHYISAGWDYTIRRWRRSDGQTVGIIDTKGHAIYRARFLADGRLVTSGYDGTIRLWDLAEGKQLDQQSDNTRPMPALAVSENGKFALTGHWDEKLRKWSLERLGEYQILEPPSGIVWDVSIAPGDKQAALARFDGPVVLWDLAQNEPTELGKHQGGALDVTYLDNGRVLLSVGRDGMLKVWDVAEKKLLNERSFGPVWIESLAVSPDGQRALLGLSAPDKVENPDPTAGQCVVFNLNTWQVEARLQTGMPCVYSAAFSADGRDLITGGGQHGNTGGSAVCLWRTVDALKFAPAEPPQRKLQPVLVKTFAGHTEYVMAVTLSRDGTLLASGGADYSVMLWDTETGERLADLKRHDEDVRAIAFTEDSHRFLTASNDRKVRIFDTDKHVLVGTLTGHTGPVTSLVLLPGGERAVSASDDKTLRLWDLTKTNSISTALFHTGRASCLALAPDGKTLASGGQDNHVIISELDGDKLVIKHRLIGHTAEVRGLAFWPDTKNGLYLFSASRDGTVRMWRADEGKHFRTNAPAIGVVYSVAVSPDGKLLAVGGGDWTKGAIKIYDLATSHVLAEIREFKGFVHSLAFTDDSRTLAAGSADKSVTLWRLDEATNALPGGDPAAITEVLQIPGHTEHVSSLAVVRDGQTLVSGSADGTVLARDIEPRVTRRALSGHRRDRQVHVAASKDGSLLASGDFDGKLRINRSGAEGVKEVDAHKDGVMSVTLSADATKILTSGCDHCAKLWNAESGELIKVLEGHTGWVCDGVFAEGDSLIVTTSFDQTIRVWNAETGKEIGQLPTHGGTAHALAASPDGATVAAGMRDGYVRLFGAKERNEIRNLVGHSDRVRDLVFTADGKHLISGSYDRTLRLWNVQSGAELAKVQHEKHIFNALAIAPDGRHVFSAGGIWKPNEETNDWTPENDYAIRKWRLPQSVWPQAAASPLDKTAADPGASFRHVAALPGHGGPVFSVAASTDGRFALSASDDYFVRLWDLKQNRQMREFKSDGAMRCVAISQDGTRAAWSGGQKTIVVWDLKQNKELKQLVGHSHWVYSLQFTKDARKLLSISRDKTVQLWDLETGEATLTLETINRQDIVARLSPDETKILASSDNFYTLGLWNVADGQLVARLGGHGIEGIYAAAFSPDGTRIASADARGVIFLWDAANLAEPLKTFRGHTGRITGLEFTPDSQRLISGGFDRALCLWETRSGSLIARIVADKPVTNCLTVLPGGKQVLSAGGWYMNDRDEFQQPGDFDVHVWDLP